jgi:hypothetical protein
LVSESDSDAASDEEVEEKIKKGIRNTTYGNNENYDGIVINIIKMELIDYKH